MKIAILGPVFTGSYFGGVATFDENLACAFSLMGHEVTLFTGQKDAPDRTPRGIRIRRSCRAAFGDERYDLAIASLIYAKELPRIRAGKKVFFLHGFYNMTENSMAKAFAAIAFEQHYCRKCDYVIANSRFTRFINREAFNVPSDASVRLGVSYDFREQLAGAMKEGIPREKNTLLYTGRLTKAKYTGQILRAMRVLAKRGKDYRLTVVGDGPDRGALERYAGRYGLNVEFAGRRSQEEIVRYYLRSGVFLSMNPSEPFGIAFCEALLAGCRIVCPPTGGQIEFLSDFPERYLTADGSDAVKFADVIEAAARRPAEPFPDLDAFTYDRTAEQILAIVSGKRSRMRA